MAHLKISCQRKVSPKFFHPSQFVSGNSYYVSVYLLLPEGWIAPLLQATVNVKLGLQLSLYFDFSIVLVFSSLFYVFRSIFRWFRVLVVQSCTSGFTIISHFFLSVASNSSTVASGPLSATFSLLAQTSSYATNCWQFALSKKKFLKNKFRICMTNETFSITFYSLSLPWNKNLGNCQEAQYAITPTSRTEQISFP